LHIRFAERGFEFRDLGEEFALALRVARGAAFEGRTAPFEELSFPIADGLLGDVRLSGGLGERVPAGKHVDDYLEFVGSRHHWRARHQFPFPLERHSLKPLLTFFTLPPFLFCKILTSALLWSAATGRSASNFMAVGNEGAIFLS
jgi:hypothetical protein